MRRSVKAMLRKREERMGCPEEPDVRPSPLEVCVEVQAEVAWRSLWAKRWRELEEEEEMGED